MTQFYALLLMLLAASSYAFASELRYSESGYISYDRDPIAELTEKIKEMLKNFTADKMDVCWKESYGRGVGRPIHACPDDQDKDAGLCYKKCKEGYKGVGPVCWEHCKPGYTDTGALCTRPAKIISSDHKKCPWYDVCGLTFAKGCSKCPEHDPPYKNDGCTCRVDVHTYAKASYGRGVGKPMGCAKEEQYDAGLCYKPCRDGYKGVGPVCWHRCPATMPVDDGAMCCTTQKDCTDFIKKVSKAAAHAIAAVVEAGMSDTEAKDALKQALKQAGAFILFSCEHFAIF